jgi:hypothetical protein
MMAVALALCRSVGVGVPEITFVFVLQFKGDHRANPVGKHDGGSQDGV